MLLEANRPTTKESVRHTKDVTQIWRDCASLRIVIQGALQVVHQKDFVPNPDCPALSDLFESVVSLQDAAKQRLSSKRSTPATSGTDWSSLDSLNKAVMTYCLAEADKWHEQTKGPNAKNLKVLNPSISSQMENVMSDPAQRALKRCRGITEEEYDDGPLYAALLKESVQKGASGDDYHAMKAASKFGKKNAGIVVDRRASKGRKIRYTPIEKLVGFMAPRPVPLSEGTPITNEELIDAYMNSLFQ
jgi:hypothetical protein